MKIPSDTNTVGRPTKFSEETIDQLCAALADGMPLRGACVVAGIGVSTLAEWREKYPRIEERMSEARERARLEALQGIRTASQKGDWRARAEWLRLTFPSDYRNNAKVDVSATASATATTGIGHLWDEETLLALQAQRRQDLTRLQEYQTERTTAGQPEA